MRRCACALTAAVVAAFIIAPLRGAGPACEPDNGGIKLPAGFCALVVADDLGTARHMTVAPNGDLYVATLGGRGAQGAGALVALRDADGDGKFEVKERFGEGSATGIALRNGYLYVGRPTEI